MSIKQMNWSGVAFASFVAPYECKPTFHPVILNVMRLTFFRLLGS